MQRKENPAKSGPLRTGELVDLSQTDVKTKAMNDAEGVLRFRGYNLDLSLLGTLKFEEVCKAANAGSTRVPFAEVGKVDGTLDSVALRPTLTETTSTLPVSWTTDGRARLNVLKLLMIRPFPVPRGQRAHIPVVPEELEGMGHTLILRFPDARFETVETRKKKAESKPEQQKEPAAAAAPSTESEPA